MISRDLRAGPDAIARVVVTDRAEGDLNVNLPAEHLQRLRSAIAPTPWTWLNQVHGATVVLVDKPGQWAGRDADGAVTATPGCTLAIHTADCAPVVIVGNGVIGVAHAGWRGIVEGVIGNTVDLIRQSGATGPLSAYLGPCIRSGSYEFGEADLDLVAAAVGDCVRGMSANGSPALNMGAAVAASLHDAGVDLLADTGIDTYEDIYFSHRTRRDVGRQATVAWIEVLP